VKWLVRLSCDACRTFTMATVDGELCPNPGHVHFRTEGQIEAWFNSHHGPDLAPVQPLPTAT
jgi:hypothetical protein